MGDIISKSPEWGSLNRHRTGDFWTELLAELNLVVINTGDSPTFVRGYRKSYIDVMYSSQKVIKKITRWEVLEVEGSIYHQLIYFEIMNGQRKTQSEPLKKPVFYQERYSEKKIEIDSAPINIMKASNGVEKSCNSRKVPY